MSFHDISVWIENGVSRNDNQLPALSIFPTGLKRIAFDDHAII